MKPLNDFIVSNVPVLHKFYDTILNNKDASSSMKVQVPEATVNNSVMFCHRFIVDYQSKLIPGRKRK